MAEREGRGGSVVAWRKFNSNSQKRFAAKRNLPVETKLCISFLSFFFFFPSSAKRAERKSLLERDPFPWNAITRTHFDRITRQFLNFRKFDRLTILFVPYSLLLLFIIVKQIIVSNNLRSSQTYVQYASINAGTIDIIDVPLPNELLYELSIIIDKFNTNRVRAL